MVDSLLRKHQPRVVVAIFARPSRQSRPDCHAHEDGGAFLTMTAQWHLTAKATTAQTVPCTVTRDSIFGNEMLIHPDYPRGRIYLGASIPAR